MRTLLRSLPLAALVLLAACRSDAPGSADTTNGDASPGGTLVIASGGEPDLLIPGLSVTIGGRMVTDMLFDRLAEIGDGLNTIGEEGFTPRLARRWSWGRDSLSLAFELDPRARWHDGRPVRASDVAFTFGLHKDAAVASPIAQYLVNIDSVSARDSLTAVVWFARRNPEQFYDAVYHVPIMPQHVYGTGAAGIRQAEVARRPVGSGRFRFVRWDAGSRLEVVSDTANYRGRALLDRVIWTVAQDPTAALTQLTSGAADLYEAVPADQAARVDSLPTIRVIDSPNMQYSFMAMNLRARKRGAAPHPVFGDVRVRRAISMGLDRPGMLRNVFGSYGKLSYGPFPRGHLVADTTLPLPRYDTAAAGALLDSAGWLRGPDGIRRRAGRPLEFAVLVPNGSRPRMAYGVLIQEQLRRLGIVVNLETLDFPTFIARQSARDYDAALQAYSTDPSAGGAVQTFGTAGAAEGGNNYFMYTSAVFDAHLDSAMAASDPARVRAHMRNAYAQLVADAPGVWLYDVLTLTGIHERIRTRTMRPDEWWAHIADWYIPEGARIARDRVGVGPATAN